MAPPYAEDGDKEFFIGTWRKMRILIGGMTGAEREDP